jgi:hypothetical protein
MFSRPGRSNAPDIAVTPISSDRSLPAAHLLVKLQPSLPQILPRGSGQEMAHFQQGRQSALRLQALE